MYLFCCAIVESVVFCSHGPRLKQFLKDHETSARYKGEKLSSKVSAGQFHDTYSKPLAQNILKTLDKRFKDVSKDVIAATRIANLRQWPLYTKKEEVTGKLITILIFKYLAKSVQK